MPAGYTHPGRSYYACPWLVAAMHPGGRFKSEGIAASQE